MKENEINLIIKISDLNANTDSEINRIAYENTYLVPCRLDIKDEEVQFMYKINKLEQFIQIKNRRTVEKLRFVINIGNALDIADEYSFKLEPDNIYYDYNYNPKIMCRDIRLPDEIVDNADFVLQYKSLIAQVFNERYSYNDFYSGGIDLMKKNKKIEKYMPLNTIEEIKGELLNDLKLQEKEDQEKYIEIKKREFKVKKYSLYSMSVIILGLLSYTIYASVFLIPFNKKVIKANNYYLEQDYEGVIQCLEKTKGLKLDKESKYQLAYSYIISQNLADNKKKNILATLNEKSDENILDYWIAIGKTNYDSAIDLAKKVQDDELLLYALLNKQKYIQDNEKMSGEEKQKAQEGLQSEIDKISKELNAVSTSQGTNSKSTNSNTSSQDTNNSSNKETTATEKQGSNESTGGLNLVPSN